MEQLQIFKEIFLGFRSLISISIVIFILYLLFYLKYNQNINDENRLLLTSLIVSTSYICLLCLIKRYIFEHNLLTFTKSLNFISAGTILQLYLPIQIYTLQRCNCLFSKLKDAVTITSLLFLFNITTITALLFIGVSKLAPLQYFLQLFTVTLIVYQCYILRHAYKDIFNSSNEHAFSLKIDLFLFGISSTMALLLTFSQFVELEIYKREAMILTLGFVNIVLLLKVIYYSRDENNMALERNQLISPLSIYKNDFFNKKKDDDLKNRLLTYFETEQPYLNPKLKINEVALYLYSNKTYLSRLINDHFNNNFSQFVNFYRINLAKDLFYKDNTMSIQQLCYDSGFGSMATFTMAFRLNVGKSPAEWCKEVKIKEQNENQTEKN
ncbi:MAG: helix-turn-helix domain-containing protein [Bacteroidales bacterium]|nr:helix-turn-helix domain-containing protein [Bacteroidales bacterium]MDD4656353.1 helix-turn-helix domain-containing protein [Bacteroidales bacterium]